MLMMLVMVLVLLIYIVFFLLSYKMSMDFESVSVYECGFEIGSSARLIFSYRFFLVAVLFLIFDVEIVLMLPVPMMYSSKIFLFFIFILVGGLMYEYKCGSLDWL